MTIRAVLFDLDGVLFDSVDLHKQAFNQALKEVRGFEIDDDTELNGKPTKTKLAILHSQGKINLCDFNKIKEIKQKVTVEMLNKVCERDQSKIDLFSYLRRNPMYSSAVITNSIRQTTNLILRKIGLIGGDTDYPDLILSNDDFNNPKPNSEPYIKAMVHFGENPERCIIVEDSPVGLEAARNTGAYVWQVRNATEVNVEGFIKFNETI